MSGRAVPTHELHVCTCCGSTLVYPVDWDERGPEAWYVQLRCPDCELLRAGVFEQRSIDAFDQELDRGTALLVGELSLLTKANMLEYVDRFIDALTRDAIQPIDF